MQMAIKDGQLLVKDTDSIQYNIIKSWNKMKWSKQKQMLIGPLDFDLLDRMSRICKLPPSVDKIYKQMTAVMKAVDDERLNEKPEPLMKYPVKLPLFAHQCRGANMALLTFGIVDPPERKHKCSDCEHMSAIFGFQCEVAAKVGNEDMKHIANLEGNKVVDCRAYKRKECGSSEH